MRIPLIVFAAALVGCGVGPAAERPPDKGAPETGRMKIRNGTRSPEAVDLTDGEILSIGWLHSNGWPDSRFCTGTLVAPRVVATASHCTQGSAAADIGFGVGLLPEEPRATFRVERIHQHPTEDAALLILAEDATAAVPELVPVHANRDLLDQAWIGRDIQAGGYGETYDDQRWGRYFATVRISDVTDSFVVVDGRGLQGICFGDSGGPVIARVGDGAAAVLAVVHGGDDNCLGTDWLTRLDRLADWMDAVSDGQVNQGPVEPPPPLTCEGFPAQSVCRGSTVRWCEPGDEQPRTLDCAATGQACDFIDDRVGHFCSGDAGRPPSNCGDVAWSGSCEGDVVVYCKEGELRRVDCGQWGMSCGWIDDSTGNYCQ